MASTLPSHQVHSTAGAIPVKNEKGQMYMVKVKVQRYVAGKKPDFASSSSSESESEAVAQKVEELKAFPVRSIARGCGKDDDENRQEARLLDHPTNDELADSRFRRLQRAKEQLRESSDEGDEDGDDDEEEDRVAKHKKHRRSGRYSDESPDHSGDEADEEEEEEETLDETELTRRREIIRKKSLAARLTAEADKAATAGGRITLGGGAGGVAGEDEDDEDEDEELEYSDEEYTSSEDEIAPKLKPVFVRACDRVTLQAKQKADRLMEEVEMEKKQLADERRKTTLKMLESELRQEMEEAHAIEDALDALDSDEGHGNPQAEQEEYEKWKVRELRRIRRDREKREAVAQEKLEIERVRQMTNEQRHQEFLRNPKLVTNKATKGKYKFLQKYYHRGAFYVTSEEDKVYQQDFAQPTLEDHFDKTKLPNVMQVKNFGRAGRTKYTHLVDQDTTAFDSPWSLPNMQASAFTLRHGGGFKQIFNKPVTTKANKKKAV